MLLVGCHRVVGRVSSCGWQGVIMWLVGCHRVVGRVTSCGW